MAEDTRPVLKSAESALNFWQGKTGVVEIAENAFKNSVYALPGFLATVRRPLWRDYLGRAMLGAVISSAAIQTGVVLYIGWNRRKIEETLEEADGTFAGAMPSGKEAARFIKQENNYLGVLGTMLVRAGVLSVGNIAMGQKLPQIVIGSLINSAVMEISVLNWTKKRLAGVSGFFTRHGVL